MEYITLQYSVLLQVGVSVLLLYLMSSILYTVAYLGEAAPTGKLSAVVIIALVMMTVKVDFTETEKATSRANVLIGNEKHLPEKVVDNKFETSVQKDLTIKPETIKP